MGVALLAANAENPSAGALLSDGLSQLEQGQLDQAQSTLKRIDPIELNGQQRQRLQNALRQIRAERREMTAEEAANKKAAEEAAKKKAAEEEAKKQAAEEAAMKQQQAEEAAAKKAANEEAAAQKKAAEEEAAEEEAAMKQQAEEAAAKKAADEEAAAQKKVADEAAKKRAEAEEAADQEGEGDGEDLMQQALTLRAQNLTAQADQAAEQGQYNRAARLYEQALAIESDNKKAKEGLETVRALLGRQEDDADLLGPYSDIIELRREQVKAEFSNAIDQAKRMREQGNFSAAMDAATLAQSKARTNRQYLSETEYQEMRKQAQQLADQIGQQQRRAEATREARASERVENEQFQRRQREAEQRRRKVQSLLRRVRDLQRELKYEQALEVLDQLLFLDPNNIAGQALKQVIQDSVIARNARDIQREKRLETARQSNENDAAAIPHTELIQYPSDWPQLTEMRRDNAGPGGAQAEENQEIREALEEPVPLNFQETPFNEAITYLSEQIGADIVVRWRALEGAGLDRDTGVTLQIESIPAERAIEEVLASVSGDLVPLSYAVQGGVITISTEENLAQNTQIVTYDIRDLIVQAPNFTEAPEFDLEQITQSSGGGGGGTGGGGGGGGLFDDNNDQQDEEDIFGLGGRSAAMMQQIMQLIRNTVRPDSWRANGGLVSSMSELNGSLIVNTTDRDHRQVKNLLEQLRQTRALQINVEARFLLVEQNFLEEVGVDVDATIDGLGDNFSPISINQETISIADRQNTGVSGSFGSTGGSTGVIDVQGPDDGDGGDGGGDGDGGSGGDQSTTARGITISGSFLSDVQVDLLVRATQANRRATQLTAPRLTFSNGQRAYVLVATQLAFITDLEPVVGTGAVGFDPEIGIVSSGVMLDVQGTVSADRRYVTMTARPSLARINRLRQIGIGLAAGGVNDGGGDGGGGGQGTVVESELEAPEIELTQVNTTVTVPDRGTILLGGQRILADVEVEAGVPVMSKIPVVNRLFTNRSTVKDERTLLILLKPSILVQEEKEQELFPSIEQQSSQPASFGGLAPQ